MAIFLARAIQSIALGPFRPILCMGTLCGFEQLEAR